MHLAAINISLTAPVRHVASLDDVPVDWMVEQQERQLNCLQKVPNTKGSSSRFLSISAGINNNVRGRYTEGEEVKDGGMYYFPGNRFTILLSLHFSPLLLMGCSFIHYS